MTEKRHDPDAFVQAVAQFIDARQLLPAGARVVVGVSGGADSVALLAVLREISAQPDRAYHLTVAHLNHGLRPSANEDARFVSALAKGWDLPCVIERRDVAALTGAGGKGVEEAARAVRYDFLGDAAEKARAGFVAVGHHADDNAETILYRILRGTHFRGLAGMPDARKLQGSRAKLVRPLLQRRRAEVEAFCRRAGLSWCADPTNANTQFRRNFIRHELLPLLRSRVNSSVDEALLRVAKAAGDLEGLVGAMGDAALDCALRAHEQHRLVLDREALAAEPRAVQTYAIRSALERVGMRLRPIRALHLEELTELVGSTARWAVDLPNAWSARRQGGELILEQSLVESGERQSAVPLLCPGVTVLPDGRRIVCRAEAFDAAAFERHCTAHFDGEEMLDAGRVTGSLQCRQRRPADKFMPLGAPGRQTVSDFLTNAKLPRTMRGRVRCICDQRGIIYVAPIRIDERVKITAGTKRVLRITIGGE